MDQMLEKLNALGVKYTFEFMGAGDYVRVKRGGRDVAAIRITPNGVVAALGLEIDSVRQYLEDHNVKMC